MKKVLLSVFILFCFAINAQPDSLAKAKDLSELSLEQLLDIEVISVSRKLQKASEAPAILTTVSQLQIQQLGAITLIDVLKYTPGMEVSMGVDGFYRLAIRGARKEGDVLLLINGQTINDFYSGRALFDLPAELIEKIEIIRGPGSALYGTNAVAGVINVFTSKKNVASVSLGNNATLKADANYYTEKNKIKFSLAVGGTKTDGANAVIDTDKVTDQSWSLTYLDSKFKTNRWLNEVYLNSNLNIGDFNVKLFNITRQQGAYAGPVYIAAPGSKLFTNQFSGSVQYDYRVADNVIISPKVYSNINNHDFLTHEVPNNYKSSVSGQLFTNGKYTKEKYLGKTYGTELDIYIKANEHFDILTGSVFEDLSMPEYELTRNYKIVGDDYKETFGNYDNIEYNQKDKRRIVFAYFLQGTYKIKKFNVTGGLRYDDYSDFGSSVNPRLGVTYKANSHLTLKGLYGKAFRAPTFQELYDNTTLGNEYGVKGNDKLKPEKINTNELGAEVTYNRFQIKYNVFYVKTNNLIRVYDPHGGGSIGVYENIGNISTYGNEAEIVVKLHDGIYFFANYSQFISVFEWNKDVVRKADVVFFDKQPDYFKNISNSPTLRLNAGLETTIKKIHVFIGANYGNQAFNNNRFYLEQDHFVNIPYYVQGNFNVGYSVTKKFSVNVIGQNIGKKYSDPDESTNINAFGQKGLLQPGPTFLLQLKYSFK